MKCATSRAEMENDMKKGNRSLIVVLSLLLFLTFVSFFGLGEDIKGVNQMRFGIDIRGGVEAIFEPMDLNRQPTENELEVARNVIEMRLDSKNIADREVTIDKGSGYIIVRFPWKSDEKEFNPEDAIAELGDMAKLVFCDEQGNVLVEGKNVRSAAPAMNKDGINQDCYVELDFDEEGAVLFEKATEAQLGKRIGIYMDDTQISNPIVETKISGGQAVINGMASYEEAKNLADKINAGSLPFSLHTTSFSTISPSMGSNALHIMVIAGCIAFILICLFMIFYYRLPGFVTCITLTIQMMLQLLALSVPQYTLTLPGIAGIILSVGMAVDANIIISERISEELRKGLSVRQATINGYKNGFTSVLDGNITTAIVAVILMLFGSGTMLSFGYTLLAGMIINMVVGVSVSKAMLLSIVDVFPINYDNKFRKKKENKIRKFYERKWICLLISLSIFIIGIVGFFLHGVRLDTQFRGGVVLSYSMNVTIDSAGMEEKIEKLTNRAVTIQETESHIDDSKSLEITLAGTGGLTPEMQKEITELVKNSAAQEDMIELTNTYSVESYIGAKALKNSIIAVILSFLFIIVYVWFRFSNLSGLPAGLSSLLALGHDVLVVFIAFIVFKIPLNDSFVAVVLTIIGYSINDTIVVYDRIRENKERDSSIPVIELVNTSISQVMARSINTSVTTGLCVLVMLITAAVFQIPSILEFSLPMFFGLISGCYSSVCIASIVWAMWIKRKQDN